METRKAQTSKLTQTKTTPEEYSAIVKSANFQKLLHEKKKFIIPFTLFFFAFYFALPILTSYTTILNKTAFGSITWAWVFAFMQFIMTWAFCMIYYKKAEKFDKLSEKILAEKGR